MDTSRHDLPALFRQLGLPDDEPAIWQFIEAHRPLPSTQRLEEAPFWSPAQAAFLREAVEQDSDWSEIVEELDALLRTPGG
ncbi:MAG: DUF2789 domain-containing protein [Gammaproteobacteria bacterium]